MKRQRKVKQAPIGKAKAVVLSGCKKGSQRIVTVDGNGPFTRHVKDGFILHEGYRLEVPND